MEGANITDILELIDSMTDNESLVVWLPDTEGGGPVE